MHLKHIVFALAPGFVYGAILKRIVGGQRATLGQFKSIVSLSGYYEGSEELIQFCGGALLNPTTVLTAAHCVDWILDEPKGFNVRAGSLYFNQSGVRADVASYVPHPDYNNDNNDFAILKLATPINESSTIGYAQLPNEDDADPVAGTIATVAGWGLDGDGGYGRPDLFWVDIPIIDRKECERDFARPPSSEITEQMFCAGTREGGKGDCRGDSGGPVTIGNVLTGVVSFSRGCASPIYPSVFARVSKAMPFIRAHL